MHLTAIAMNKKINWYVKSYKKNPPTLIYNFKYKNKHTFENAIISKVLQNVILFKIGVP